MAEPTSICYGSGCWRRDRRRASPKVRVNLIIAQALTESVPLVSIDTAFDTYPVQRVW